MKKFIPLWALVIPVLCITLTIRAGDVFTFAGFTFNQFNTPDRARLLGTNAVLGGATFSAALPSTPTAVINFPGGTGFTSALCLAPLTGISSDSVRAINLPLGNNGSATRHGVEVYWSNGRGILNLTNVDVVVYESGSTSSGVEGVMARAHYTNTWSDWYYFPPDGFQTTAPPEGLFSYGFDFSEMGVPTNAPIDLIQLANLTQLDRISTTNAVDIGSGVLVGQGKVVFDGSTTVYPDAGNFAASRRFVGTNEYDPDPLYVAAMQEACELTAPTLSIARSGTNVTITWPAPSCYFLQTTTNLASTNIVWQLPPQTTVLNNGLMTVVVSSTNKYHYYRLYK